MNRKQAVKRQTRTRKFPDKNNQYKHEFSLGNTTYIQSYMKEVNQDVHINQQAKLNI